MSSHYRSKLSSTVFNYVTGGKKQEQDKNHGGTELSVKSPISPCPVFSCVLVNHGESYPSLFLACLDLGVPTPAC